MGQRSLTQGSPPTRQNFGAARSCTGPTHGGFENLAKERVERDEEDLVRLYLTDIGQYPLLTKDDEVRLAQAIEARWSAEEELRAKSQRHDSDAPSRA